MSLNLSTDSLRSILSLSEKRDALLAELQKVETEISKALGSGTVAKASTLSHKTGNGRAAATTGGKKISPKRGKRGAVKELILAGLKEAGEAGIAVKHLAAKLAIKPQNIHVWLHTTGKKSGLVEAAGKGVYRLKQAVGVEAPRSIVEVPKPKVAEKTRKAVGTRKSRKNVKSYRRFAGTNEFRDAAS